MSPKQRRLFTDEQKSDTVRIVEQSDKPISQVAKELGISESAVRKWVNQARIDEKGSPQGALTTTERQELAQLRKDNKRLQMERDFLKKAAAFLRQSVGGVPPLKGTAVAKDTSTLMS
jgi:transposase